MVGWREYFLVLGFFGKLGRKDLAFDVTVGFDIGDWKSYALVHHFSVGYSPLISFWRARESNFIGLGYGKVAFFSGTRFR